MSERTKKILFAVFFITFSLGMGYLLYYMLFQARTPQSAQPEISSFSGSLPRAEEGTGTTSTPPSGPGTLPESPTAPGAEAPTGPVRTQLLRDGITQAVTPTPDGSGARFYNPEDGRFYRVSGDGTITLLGEKQFYNVDQIHWGNQDDQVILEFPDGSNIFYDFDSKTQVTLPKHWEEFDFSPTDDHVAAKSIGVDPENRFLITSNPNGTEAKAIEALGNNANLVQVSWAPHNQVIAFSRTGEPQGGNQEEILLVGQNHENFRSLIAPGQGFLPNWSPTGKYILFSVWNHSSENKPDLWITSGDPGTIGTNRKDLHIYTWADKCVWASDSEIYCAVPQNLPANAGLQREDFATLPDDVYRIDLNAGSMTKINGPDQTHPVRQPVLNRDKTKFIFSDAETGKLYSYNLK